MNKLELISFTHIVELVTVKCCKLIWIELLAYTLCDEWPSSRSCFFSRLRSWGGLLGLLTKGKALWVLSFRKFKVLSPCCWNFFNSFKYWRKFPNCIHSKIKENSFKEKISKNKLIRILFITFKHQQVKFFPYLIWCNLRKVMWNHFAPINLFSAQCENKHKFFSLALCSVLWNILTLKCWL